MEWGGGGGCDIRKRVLFIVSLIQQNDLFTAPVSTEAYSHKHHISRHIPQQPTESEARQYEHPVPACNSQRASARHDARPCRSVGTKVADFKQKNRNNFKFCRCMHIVSAHVHISCTVPPLLGYGEPTRCCCSCSDTAVYGAYVGPPLL
jgi:hypothetical protein